HAAIDFAHEVVPILKAHCVECHGGSESKGGFSMNTRGLVLEAEVVEVGKPDESYLIEVLETDDPDDRMPPVKKQKEPLAPEKVAVLKRWIAEGLPWEDGFTFAEERYEPPLKPRQVTLPDGPAGANPIDLIIAAYFEENGLVPPKPLDDASFVRRLSLDVVGLPPSQELKVAWLSGGPSVREAAIEAIFSDRRGYAEHWMTFWNDLLRNTYSGTGFIDGGRKQITGWLYKALHDNKPYDQFVRELVSPGGESEGFIRGIKWRGDVNASQTREVQFSQSVSQVFLGINMKCASCHDSFVDRWTLEEAYSLAAVFSQKPMELYRCDKPTGKTVKAAWIFPELGAIDPDKPQKERLAQLAGLMTHPENGRMQRTIVNRLWKQMMGRGIVHPVDAMGTEPWSAELLDYLANHLVEQNYDLKAVLRLIAGSKTYQAQTVVEPEQAEEYVFRGPVMKRMTAEQFLDSIYLVTGAWPEPDKRALSGAGRSQGGQLKAIMAVHGEKGWGSRPLRSVFQMLDPLQAALGRPNRDQIVSSRPETVTTLEAINLANGPALATILQDGAERLIKLDEQWKEAVLAANPGGRYDFTATLVQHVYRTALSRDATTAENALAKSLIGDTVTPEGVSDFLWSVFMLPEFQFVN
ncbi:MAG: DUF1553 domain-containing protein, partial [Akkermansiaceae bacterium]|nr:DUF1553 domain-containing protein [Akkermansiaceae bacterium]